MTARLLPWLRERRVPLLVLAVVLVVGVVVGGQRASTWLEGERDDEFVVTADFTDTTGLYVGNRVTYLGVPIGEVHEVEPRGTTMRVVLHLEEDAQVPAEAGAEIVQGSLVTDRYVELGPAYRGGPALAAGDHIPADHTRSPATVDEIATALDELVLALDAGGRGGKGLGELIATTADGLEGNGPALDEALTKGRRALATINSKQADLASVTTALSDLVAMLSARDEVLRSFTEKSADAVDVLADQRADIVATLASLDELVRRADRFLKENGDVLAEDLARIDDVVTVVRRHQDSLEESFDVMPTMAENFARAYDWDLGRLRVQFSFEAGPFHSAFRDEMCRAMAGVAGFEDLCARLFRPDGTGLLDPLLGGLYDALPTDLP